MEFCQARRNREIRKIRQEPDLRVYVACLASYNRGILHGAWIDCYDEEQMKEDIQDMLLRSPVNERKRVRVNSYAKYFSMHDEMKEVFIQHAEEYAIHDTDGFGGRDLEFCPFSTIVQLSDLIREHGDIANQVVSYVGGVNELKEAKRMFEEQFLGTYDSLDDFAEEYWAFVDIERIRSQIPAALRRYLELRTDKWARDEDLNGSLTYFEEGGQIYVFG